MNYLLLDGHCLAHRAMHSTGELEHEGQATGVAYGVITEIEYLTELYAPDRVVIAFDYGGKGLRGAINPDYKITRRTKERTKEEAITYEFFLDQIKRLKDKILPGMGYKNVICLKGYEGDDIIAAAVDTMTVNDTAVIVSTDQDMWQCLSSTVICHNPITRRITTAKSFRDTYNIEPSVWADVKALGGCKSDDVIGIEGIGDKTAAKWFSGHLKPKSKAYKKVLDQLNVHSENIALVRLPFEGIQLPELVDDEITLIKINAMKFELGMKKERRSGTKKEFEGFDV